MEINREPLTQEPIKGPFVNADSKPDPVLIEWNKLATDFVLANMAIGQPRNGLVPIQKVYEKMNRGLEAVRSVQEMRQRLIAEAITRTIELLEVQSRTTPWFRFRLRAELKAKLSGARVVEAIVRTTAPPAGWKILRRSREDQVVPEPEKAPS